MAAALTDDWGRIERFFPEIVELLARHASRPCVLDGELNVIVDGRAAFDTLQARPELVVVGFDQVTGERFRHGTRSVRWRPDKAPRQCRMEQLGF
jgi:ATP-dependent DNA ligase